jgi:hypothetical protein
MGMYPTKDSVLQTLRSRGWLIEPSQSRRLATARAACSLPGPTSIANRVPGWAQGVCQRRTDRLVSVSGRFRRVPRLCLALDEFERMLLEWAKTGQERNAVVAFWNSHFPFLLSVRTGYAFLRCAWVRADKVIK